MLIITNIEILILNLINNKNEYLIEIIILLGVILLASSIGKAVLDHGHKVLTGTAAGMAIISKAKSMIESGGDSEDDNKNDDNKKDKNTDKKDENKESNKSN